jgi:hypothetical protein
LVFADTPTLITPIIGAATGTSVNLSGGGTFGGTIVGTNSSGLALTASSAGVELGAAGTTNTPFIDVHSSSSSTDYDVRMIVSGGTGSSGGGTLTITADTVGLSASPAANDSDLSVATTAFVQGELLDGATIVTESGTTRTLTAADKGKWIRFTNASGCAVTINTSVFATEDEVYFENAAAGEVSFTGTATINRGTYTLAAQYDVGAVKFSSSSVCTLFGAITAP